MRCTKIRESCRIVLCWFRIEPDSLFFSAHNTLADYSYNLILFCCRGVVLFQTKLVFKTSMTVFHLYTNSTFCTHSLQLNILRAGTLPYGKERH
jgi:hypothetical protein